MRADANLQVYLSAIVNQTKGRIEKVMCHKREKKAQRFTKSQSIEVCVRGLCGRVFSLSPFHKLPI